MANKLNRYLNQDPTGPKGVLANYQHATDVFVENNYRLAPRYKFLFHAFFEIDNTVPTVSSIMNVRANEEISLLVKTANLPSYNFDTVTKNQYNRKKIVYKQINYEPVTMAFHDDNAGIMNALWAAYYEYFVNDRSQSDPNRWLMDNSKQSFIPTKYGMDVDTPVRFFKRISLYTLSRQKWNGYTLWGPRIKSWKHGDVDYSEGNGIIENNMTIEYEGVSYESGLVSEGKMKGFATTHYDKEPSSLNTGGGGNAADIFNEAPDPDFLDPGGDYLNETISSVQNYRDIPGPSGASIDSVFNGNGVSNQVGGVLNAQFPKVPTGVEGTIATRKRLNPLESLLQDPKAPAYTGDDPIVRARLGLPPLEDLPPE